MNLILVSPLIIILRICGELQESIMKQIWTKCDNNKYPYHKGFCSENCPIIEKTVRQGWELGLTFGIFLVGLILAIVI